MVKISNFFGKILCKIGLHRRTKWEYIQNSSCQQIKTCKRCGKEKKRIKHNWGTWGYEASNSCQQERKCQRCNERQKGGVLHNWEWRYVSQNSCKEQKVCRRCNAKKQEFRTREHLWGNWEYETANSCRLVRVCRRCKEKERGEEKHEWQSKNMDTTHRNQIEQQFAQRINQLTQEYSVLVKKLPALNKRFMVETDGKKKFNLREQITTLENNRKRIENSLSIWKNRLSEIKNSGKMSCHQKCKRCGKIQEGNHQWSEWEYESITSCRMVQYCLQCGKKQSDSKTEHQWDSWKKEKGRKVRYCHRCGEKHVGELIVEYVGPDWSNVSPQTRERVERLQNKK